MIDQDWQRIVVEILTAETGDLRSLARIAGADYRTFYRGANFRDADLTGQDLTDLDLEGARHNNPVVLFRFEDSDFDDEVDETLPRSVRVNITINQAIHGWLKRRNRGMMNAHVERLLLCFFREHLMKYVERGSRGSEYLESEILTLHSEEIGYLTDRRSPVAYSMRYKTRELLYRVSEMLQFTIAETLRISIYWVLLHDKVRGFSQFKR